jgi:hypothetical protein
VVKTEGTSKLKCPFFLHPRPPLRRKSLPDLPRVRAAKFTGHTEWTLTLEKMGVGDIAPRPHTFEAGAGRPLLKSSLCAGEQRLKIDLSSSTRLSS